MSLLVNGIDKSFSCVKALKNVSLELEKGSIHALVGENGAGKSTLLQIMAGIYRADSGRVELDGAPVYENTGVKERIAFVPTQCGLFSDYREKELIRLYAGIYARFDISKYHEITKKVAFEKKTVRKLSTGMQMTVGVALALAAMPDVLLLDEPFAGLDVIVRRRLIDALIEESGSRELAILVSSHNVNELEKLCDSATFLSRGKITQSGSMMNVKKNAVRRLQVVFLQDAPGDLAAWEGVLSVESIGKVNYLTVDGMDESIDARLKAVGVLMMEELGVTLEEAFLYSYEQGEGKQ